MALEGRGFGAIKDRTFYLEIGFKKGDFLALALTLFFFWLLAWASGSWGLEGFLA